MMNLFKLAASSFLLTALVQAAPTSPSKQMAERSGCASDNGGVHIIVARGSTEPPGEGALASMSGMIKAGIPGSTSEGVNYPALFSPYQWSVDQGTAALTQTIENHVAQCPRSRIVLLGYSQGGQVVMNGLCGTSEDGFTPSPRLEEHLWKHIAAVLVYADPSHVAGKSYDVGTSYTSGMFQRLNPALCEPFARRIQAYCDDGDPYCAMGADGYVHTEYFSKYDATASQWMIHKARAHLPWLRNN